VRVDAAVKEALDTMIQDEYRLEQTYLRVLRDFGEMRPFSNIVRAEQRHSAAITALYTARGLPVPASRWSAEDVPAYRSVREACAAAIEGERANIALYDRYLERPLPDDVRATFEYNRRASAEHHLPALRRCAERR
jgi:rubrerythrin